MLQSQECESFFRTSRSFTSTESTVVNFDMQSFESRLHKIEAKIEIMHKCKDDFQFPRLKRAKAADSHLNLPSNSRIAEIVRDAKNEASRLINLFSIEVTEELFRECIYLRKPKEKCDEQVGKFEFVPCYEEVEEIDNEDIYEADELFLNSGSELHVRDSKNCNDRNTFKIRHKNGKLIHVKKSTFIWMLQADFERVSSDRLQRFSGAAKNDQLVMVHLNETRQYLSIGEWIMMDLGNGHLSICKVYEFTYLSGKRRSYTRFTAPINAPEDVEVKGIGVKGAYFELVRIDCEYKLELHDNSDMLCIAIENYVTHLERPAHVSGIIIYNQMTARYIDMFLN